MKYAIAGTALIILGSLLVTFSGQASERLAKFCSNYPLVRLVSFKQHRARSGFIKLLGTAFILIGIAFVFLI